MDLLSYWAAHPPVHIALKSLITSFGGKVQAPVKEAPFEQSSEEDLRAFVRQFGT